MICNLLLISSIDILFIEASEIEPVVYSLCEAIKRTRLVWYVFGCATEGFRADAGAICLMGPEGDFRGKAR
jgi:hypothetical protein